MGSMTKWLAALCILGAFAIASCGNSTAPTASPRLGVLAGVADQCSGLPIGGVPRPVQVLVFRQGEKSPVLAQTRLGSHRFRFSLPAGKYSVTSNQSYAVQVDVEVEPGQVAHASIYSACD